MILKIVILGYSLPVVTLIASLLVITLVILIVF